jgi:hypothetical protein
LEETLDDNKFIAAILMDLSKAFDCLPHNLLMLKLETGNNYSEWDTLIKGVPQCSILGLFYLMFLLMTKFGCV